MRSRLAILGWVGTLCGCGSVTTLPPVDGPVVEDPPAMKVDLDAPAAAVVILPDAEVMRLPNPRPPLDPAPEADAGLDRAAKVDRLLKRHGVKVSASVPADKRLDWSKPVVLRPADPAAAWREYRKAWLQNDGEAAFALLAESSRAAIREQLTEWARTADRIGLDALLVRLTDSGCAHHVPGLRSAGEVRGYGVRQFFDAAWAAQRADAHRVAEVVNCWETGWTPESAAAARISGRVVAPVLGSVREVEVRAVRESFDAAWHVEMEIR